MELVKEHLCWIKVSVVEDDVSLDESAFDAEAEVASISSAAQAQLTKAPRLKANPTSTPFVASRPTAEQSPIHFLHGGRPPTKFAGSMVSAWWNLDKDYSGVRGDKTHVEILPFIGDREEAIDWLYSEPGQEWLSGAITYFLTCFTIKLDI